MAAKRKRDDADSEHLTPLTCLVIPQLRELCEKAFNALDATQDGMIGREDFMKRVESHGNASAEDDLYKRVFGFWGSFQRDEHIDKAQFLQGIVASALSAPLTEPPHLSPSEFYRALLFRALRMVNTHVTTVVVDLLRRLNAPVTDAERKASDDAWAAFQQAELGMGDPTIGKLRDEMYHAALKAWTSGTQNLMNQYAGDVGHEEEVAQIYTNILAETEAVRTGVTVHDLTSVSTLLGLSGAIREHLNSRLREETDKATAAKQVTPNLMRQLDAGVALLSIEAMAALEKAWNLLDKNGDKVLSREDFAGHKDAQIFVQLLSQFDSAPFGDSDGVITQKEFFRGFVRMAMADASVAIPAFGNLMTLDTCLAGFQDRLSRYVLVVVQQIVTAAQST